MVEAPIQFQLYTRGLDGSLIGFGDVVELKIILKGDEVSILNETLGNERASKLSTQLKSNSHIEQFFEQNEEDILEEAGDKVEHLSDATSAWSLLDEQEASKNVIEEPMIERNQVQILFEDRGVFDFF